MVIILRLQLPGIILHAHITTAAATTPTTLVITTPTASRTTPPATTTTTAPTARRSIPAEGLKGNGLRLFLLFGRGLVGKDWDAKLHVPGVDRNSLGVRWSPIRWVRKTAMRFLNPGPFTLALPAGGSAMPDSREGGGRVGVAGVRYAIRQAGPAQAPEVRGCAS
ncbi:hypothetical protein EJ06DRAFT_519505 [Trichodelitschia bisporula]|uniref:Uncharacterized protein n=1 Tax=Trichodelitschia bisporula TaxID=703511 RepID=A0A6G1I6P4_9PEZI|nr:hypothetical protein EJ06DRAFT_519505 [Trichodelitschia bisporula]